jgi:hypothetical protein
MTMKNTLEYSLHFVRVNYEPALARENSILVAAPLVALIPATKADWN